MISRRIPITITITITVAVATMIIVTVAVATMITVITRMMRMVQLAHIDTVWCGQQHPAVPSTVMEWWAVLVVRRWEVRVEGKLLGVLVVVMLLRVVGRIHGLDVGGH